MLSLYFWTYKCKERKEKAQKIEYNYLKTTFLNHIMLVRHISTFMLNYSGGRLFVMYDKASCHV